MRRIFFATGTSVLIMLTWTTAPVMAAEHGHAEYGHGAGVGSVHYGAREAPARVGPAAPAVVARPEHNAGPGPRVAYRNPYRDDYFRRFPAGYYPFVFNDAQYYGYYSLPVGCQVVVLGGITYYLLNGVYFQAYIYGGQTVYVAVPAPV